MNIYNARSMISSVEMKTLMNVENQIIAPQYNKPILSFIMDSLVGMYRLTQDRKIPENVAYDMLACLDNINIDLKSLNSTKINNIKYYEGKDILSYVLPNINYKCKDFIIENGKIKSGIIDKKVVGKSNGSLIHIINNDMGSNYVTEFMGRALQLLHVFMKNEGFSVGLSDIIVDNDINNKIKVIINEVKIKIDEYIQKTYKNKKKIIMKDFESKIFSLLNNTIDDTGKLVINSIKEDNALINMVKCGSKGSSINVSQMTCLVGQQNVQEGASQGRITDSYNDRPMAHFQKYDNGAESRGFISSNYLKGLNPIEFFYHSKSGREGLIDTAY